MDFPRRNAELSRLLDRHWFGRMAIEVWQNHDSWSLVTYRVHKNGDRYYETDEIYRRA